MTNVWRINFLMLILSEYSKIYAKYTSYAFKAIHIKYKTVILAVLILLKEIIKENKLI